jgi:orotate phosphoribosyltransferase
MLYKNIVCKQNLMRNPDINTMLVQTNAMLKGHFVLSSGLHSEKYLQCALLLSYPQYAMALCRQLARFFVKNDIDIVVGPAYGGIIVAYELAKALKAQAVFTERKDGQMQLRRGFTIHKGQRVLIAEDVITTGRSVKEVICAIKPYRPAITGIASLIDRSHTKNLFGRIRLTSVKKIAIKTYDPERCPLCKQNIPLVKPGSRLEK